MPKDKPYSEDAIQALTPKQWIQVKVLDVAPIDSLYVIIGFLQEYFGGYALQKETVDLFFVNEYDKAQLFVQLCRYYLTSINCPDDVELVKVETGHSYVRSPQICTQLKQIFTVKKPDFLQHQCYTLSKDDDLYKNPKELYGHQKYLFNFKRYSYLLGVFIKNALEHEPVVHFANADDKAQFTIEILKEFNAFGDAALKVNYFFGTPTVTKIILSEDNLLWGAIDQYLMDIQQVDH
ncbi:MAG: hypothetical protein AB8E82_03925 [Aureispira sp.]